jgi:hypothetical protein
MQHVPNIGHGAKGKQLFSRRVHGGSTRRHKKIKYCSKILLKNDDFGTDVM